MNLPRFGSADASFDERGTYVPAHLPDADGFLRDSDPLTGDAHTTVHGWTHDVFEARGVYDATFGYNLARLNLDSRHPDAGIRYAEHGDELRAVFTPTTAFCPQAESLAVAAFRAWNDVGDGPTTPEPPSELTHVRVRVGSRHRASERINERLRELEAEFD